MATVTGKIRVNANGKLIVATGNTLVTNDDPDQECCCPPPPDPCVGCGDGDPNLTADLITNGDFNADTTGWTIDAGHPQVISNAASGYPDQDPTWEPTGPAYFFLVGDIGGSFPAVRDAFAQIHQDVDISGYSAAVDDEEACFRLTCLLGTFADGGLTHQNDNVIIEVMAGAAVLGFASQSGELPPGDYNNFWAEYTFAGRVPVGTRTLRVRVSMTRDAAAPTWYANDGYVDKVVLKLCAAHNP